MANFNDITVSNSGSFGESAYTFGDVRLDMGGGYYSPLVDTSGSSATYTDLTGSSTNLNDYNNTYLTDSNINVFDVNALALNDVYPWIINIVGGFSDLTGTGNNFTDL